MKGNHQHLALLDRIAAPVIILAIFSYLLAVVGYNTCSCSDQGNVAAAKAQIKQFETAVWVYAMEYGAAPASMDDLIWPPSGKSILTSEFIPLDPWGNPYDYWWAEPDHYEIISYGADGKTGGDDEDRDISSLDFGAPDVSMIAEFLQSNSE